MMSERARPGPENNDIKIGSAGGDMTAGYHLSSVTITQLQLKHGG